VTRRILMCSTPRRRPARRPRTACSRPSTAPSRPSAPCPARRRGAPCGHLQALAPLTRVLRAGALLLGRSRRSRVSCAGALPLGAPPRTEAPAARAQLGVPRAVVRPRVRPPPAQLACAGPAAHSPAGAVWTVGLRACGSLCMCCCVPACPLCAPCLPRAALWQALRDGSGGAVCWRS